MVEGGEWVVRILPRLLNGRHRTATFILYRVPLQGYESGEWYGGRSRGGIVHLTLR